MNLKSVLLISIAANSLFIPVQGHHQCQGGSYLETYDHGENYIWRHQLCPVGEFAPQEECLVNQNPCQPCPYGTFQNKTGQLNCLLITSQNCSKALRQGLRVGATEDGCFFCEGESVRYEYRDGLCVSCGNRYTWRRDPLTNHTQCIKTNPFHTDVFKVLFSLSIVFLALSAYLVDQIDFSKWCYLTGVTINVLVSALVYYDTDIEDIDSIKWMVIGLIIEFGCIGIHLFVKSYRRPITGDDRTTDPETVCFE